MRPLSVAHVGHVDAPDDHARWLSICRWLEDNDRAFFDLLRAQEADGVLEQHFIDLNGSPPRDFLTEQHRHDLVITHNLWGEESEGYPVRSGGAAQSVHHTAANWRRRLCATGAQYIVLAGTAFNFGQLGAALPGYEKVAFQGRWYITFLRALPAGGPPVT